MNGDQRMVSGQERSGRDELMPASDRALQRQATVRYPSFVIQNDVSSAFAVGQFVHNPGHWQPLFQTTAPGTSGRGPRERNWL